MNKYPLHANQDDRRCAAALVQAILDTGAVITVDCGEGLEIRKSSNKLDILKAMSATGFDYLVCWKKAEVQDVEGKVKYDRQGWFSLIYDNGSEGEPMILISDHVANEYCDKVYNVVQSKMEG